MRRIDIHTGDELNNDEHRYNNNIKADIIKSHVFNTIDFSISEAQWETINAAFSEYWNNIIGIGGYFYWDEVATFIFNRTKEKNQLISFDRVETIVNLMLTKIENDGGFMD